MDKSKKSLGEMHSSIKSTLISVLVGEVITIICLFIFSILIAKMNVPLSMTDVFVMIAASLGSLFAGYCNGRMRKEKGLLYGAFSGGVMVLILIIFNVIFNSFALSSLTFVKLALVMVLSIVGCVIGVNKKSKRIKY